MSVPRSTAGAYQEGTTPQGEHEQPALPSLLLLLERLTPQNLNKVERLTLHMLREQVAKGMLGKSLRVFASAGPGALIATGVLMLFD